MKKISVILIMIVALASCSKDSNQINNENSFKKTNNDSKILSENDSIYGVIHNDCLDYISKLPGFPYITQNKKLLEEYISNFFYQKYNIVVSDTRFKQNTIKYSSVSELSLDLLNNNHISEQVNRYLIQLDTITFYSNDFTEFDNNITNVVSSALNDQLLNSYQQHVIISSAYFFRSTTLYWIRVINDFSSPWYLNMDYFPVIKNATKSKLPFFIRIQKAIFADVTTFINELNGCGEYCPDNKPPYKATDCGRVCAQGATYNSIYSSVMALF